jgi:hypothetical protein
MKYIKRIDAYYKYLKDENTKTKYCETYSTGNYSRLEILRNKKNILTVYLVSDNYTKARKISELKLAAKGVHISRVIQCKANSKIAYGDVKHTNDLLIFIFNEDKTEFELLIVKGKKYECNLYLNMLLDGVLNDEITNLRQLEENLSKAA